MSAPHADDVSRRAPYLFPVPAGPLRSLLDHKAQSAEPFSEDEAALDVMLALDRDDLRPVRYYVARWKWTRYRVSTALDGLRTTSAEWRGFHRPSVRQDQPESGQDQPETGPEASVNAAFQPESGQDQPESGQYRPDPDTRPRKNPSEKYSARAEPEPGKPRRKTKAPARGPEPPDFIDAETWADWQAHRREKGKTLKPTEIKHQIKQLTAWNDAGHDANAILLKSIGRGWTGLFEPDARDAARGDAAAKPRGGRGAVGGAQRQPDAAAVRRGGGPDVGAGHGGARRGPTGVPVHADGSPIRLTASERAGQIGPQYAADLIAEVNRRRLARAEQAAAGSSAGHGDAGDG